MSDKPKFNTGDFVIALENCGEHITKGGTYRITYIPKEYNGLIGIKGDMGYQVKLRDSRFKLKEEEKMSEVEKEFYVVNASKIVSEVLFKGDSIYLLKRLTDGIEWAVSTGFLGTIASKYTKETRKQQKKNEDLGVLANVTDEIRKLLDDNHVICHVNVNRDTKGLVEFSLMLGESV